MSALPATMSIDPRLLQSLQGIKLRSRLLVRGLYNNFHKTSDFGNSNEFVEHRDYRPGDEIRTIDWRLYARTDRLYVKRYEMEANMKVHFLLDTSDSMRVPPPEGLPSKLDLSAAIVGAAATMVASQQDSPGLVCLADGVAERIPPRQGNAHLHMLYTHLENPTGSGGGDFGEDVRRSTAHVGSRGIVVVVSDCVDDPESLFDAIKGLRVRGQDVCLFQVLDRDEREFPFDGMTEFRHPETGDRLVGDPTLLRRRYLERLERHLAAIDDFCNRRRIDFLRLDNRDDLIVLLRSHFLRRLAAAGGA